VILAAEVTFGAYKIIAPLTTTLEGHASCLVLTRNAAGSAGERGSDTHLKASSNGVVDGRGDCTFSNGPSRLS